jgi:hypothetical protein
MVLTGHLLDGSGERLTVVGWSADDDRSSPEPPTKTCNLCLGGGAP